MKINDSLVKKAKTLCLQEIHIRKKDQRLLENGKLGIVYYSLSDKKVRGVFFILIQI